MPLSTATPNKAMNPTPAEMENEQGEIGYVEYVDALQESIDLRLKRAEAINDYNQAVVCLQRLDNGFGK